MTKKSKLKNEHAVYFIKINLKKNRNQQNDFAAVLMVSLPLGSSTPTTINVKVFYDWTALYENLGKLLKILRDYTE